MKFIALSLLLLTLLSSGVVAQSSELVCNIPSKYTIESLQIIEMNGVLSLVSYLKPELITVNDGFRDDESYISPRLDDVPFDSFEIEVSQPVSFVHDKSSSVHVVELIDLGNNKYEIKLNHGVPIQEWTTISFEVESEHGVRATFDVKLSHMPFDFDMNGQVSLNDMTVFGNVYNGDRDLRIIDMDGNGQFSLNDFTGFGRQLRIYWGKSIN